MADHRSRVGKHGGHPGALVGQGWVADRVYAPVDPVQVADCAAPPDSLVAQAGRQQLQSI